MSRFEVIHNELDELSGEIAARQSTAQAPDLGRLSAEAVQASYKAAAAAVEELKEPIRERTQKLEAALKGCDEAMKALEDWIRKIEDSGNLIAAQIDEANVLSGEMIKMAGDYIAKVR